MTLDRLANVIFCSFVLLFVWSGVLAFVIICYLQDLKAAIRKVGKDDD